MSKHDVRRAAAAGTFYPADRSELRRAVTGMLAGIDAGRGPEPLGLIVPHAGYSYSGPVAAAAYGLIAGLGYEAVVLLGPAHRFHFRGASVGDFGLYETPLGRVPVDRPAVDELLAQGGCVGFHPQAHDGEHSLEVQLPFLQVRLQRPRIVPILIGDWSFQTCGGLVSSLHRLFRDKRVLFVASTDLSHHHTEDDAKARDGRTLETILTGDPERFHGDAEIGKCELCGASAVTVLLLLAKLRNAPPPRLLRQATSGDSGGDRSRVVGYASLVIDSR